MSESVYWMLFGVWAASACWSIVMFIDYHNNLSECADRYLSRSVLVFIFFNVVILWATIARQGGSY